MTFISLLEAQISFPNCTSFRKRVASHLSTTPTNDFRSQMRISRIRIFPLRTGGEHAVRRDDPGPLAGGAPRHLHQGLIRSPGAERHVLLLHHARLREHQETQSARRVQGLSQLVRPPGAGQGNL